MRGAALAEKPAMTFIITRLIKNAGVAQLVEQGFCKPQVRGSSPCAGTTTIHKLEIPMF